MEWKVLVKALFTRDILLFLQKEYLNTVENHGVLAKWYLRNFKSKKYYAVYCLEIV